MACSSIDFAEAMRRQAVIDNAPIEANAPLEAKSEQVNQNTLQEKTRPLEGVNLSLCSGEHYLENFPPSFDWLLKDSLRNACIGLVVAPPGCAKGQFCIQLIAALAAGLPCLGTWTPTQQVKALYLSAEDDALILHRRLFHTLKSLPYETQERAASKVYAIPVSGDVGLYDPVTGKTTPHFTDLKKLIATHRPQVLIIVIATRRKSGVMGLTVRCPYDRPKDRPKYWQVVGSSKVPFVVGSTGQAVVLLESALDAVLVRQESQNTVAAVAVMGSTKGLDAQTKTFIEQAPSIIACPDNDEAGHKAWFHWREEFPRAVRIAPVGAKDLGDMHRLATIQAMQGECITAPFVGEWVRIALEIA